MKKLIVASAFVAATLFSGNAFAFSGSYTKGVDAPNTSAVKVSCGCHRTHYYHRSCGCGCGGCGYYSTYTYVSPCGGGCGCYGCGCGGWGWGGGFFGGLFGW